MTKLPNGVKNQQNRKSFRRFDTSITEKGERASYTRRVALATVGPRPKDLCNYDKKICASAGKCALFVVCSFVRKNAG